MPKKSAKRKPPNGVPITSPAIDIHALNLYRLEHGLSFKELGDQIHVNATTLYAVLRGRTRTQPRDTTAYRIQQFCAHHGVVSADHRSR